MIPMLFEANTTDFSKTPIGYLTDCITCTVEEKVNDMYEISMQYPVNGNNYALIQNERLILVKIKDGNSNDRNNSIYQPFSIYKISRPINQIVTVYAQHVSYLASYVIYKPLSLSEDETDIKGIDALVERLNDPENLVPGVRNPFKISYRNLADNTCQYHTSTPTSLRSMIGGDTDSIINKFKYEVEFDKFNIIFTKTRGSDNGIKIAYSKNLTNFEHTEELDSVVTAIIPYVSSNDTSATGPLTYMYQNDGYKLNHSGAPQFETNKYYELNSEDQYQLLTVAPLHWTSQWRNYFIQNDGGQYEPVPSVVIPFQPNRYYSKNSITEQYELLTEEPLDWASSMNSDYSVHYYEKYHMDDPSPNNHYRPLINNYGDDGKGSPSFGDRVYYKNTDPYNSEDAFEVIMEQPTDWAEAWAEYYYYWYDENSKYSTKYHTNRISTSDLSSSFQEAPTNLEFMSFYAREYMKKEKTYKPKISMNVSFVALWQTEEYKNVAPLEYVAIGDVVHIYFPAYDIYSEARVSQVIYNVITEQYDSIELGEPAEGFAENSATANIDTKEIISNTSRDLSTKYDRDIKKALSELSGVGSSVIQLNRDENGNITSITASDNTDINDASYVVAITSAGIGLWSKDASLDDDRYDPEKLTAVLTAGKLVIPASTIGTLDADNCKITHIKAENIVVKRNDESKPLKDYINIEPGKITIGTDGSSVKMVSLPDRLAFVDTTVFELVPAALHGYNSYTIPDFISNFYYDNDNLLMDKPNDWNDNENWDLKNKHVSTKFRQRKVYAYISDDVFYTNEIRTKNTERIGRFQKTILEDGSLILVRGG